MLSRNEIIKILKDAEKIDSKYELFGANIHKYNLNFPTDPVFVRTIESKYGFTLPDDYFRYITEIADGGAGPDYGIYLFSDLVKIDTNLDAKEYDEAYKNSLKNTFSPRPMLADEVKKFGFSQKAYDECPEKLFVYEKSEDEICMLDGFLILGTRGCQWDFGMALNGKMGGKIFTCDNQGGYYLEADSFDEFYQNWLYNLCDKEDLKNAMKKVRKSRKVHFWQK